MTEDLEVEPVEDEAEWPAELPLIGEQGVEDGCEEGRDLELAGLGDEEGEDAVELGEAGVRVEVEVQLEHYVGEGLDEVLCVEWGLGLNGEFEFVEEVKNVGKFVFFVCDCTSSYLFNYRLEHVWLNRGKTLSFCVDYFENIFSLN